MYALRKGPGDVRSPCFLCCIGRKLKKFSLFPDLLRKVPNYRYSKADEQRTYVEDIRPVGFEKALEVVAGVLRVSVRTV